VWDYQLLDVYVNVNQTFRRSGGQRCTRKRASRAHTQT